MNMLTRKLIGKEFYLHRWLIGGSIVAGFAGLLIAADGLMRFNIGMLIWLTTIVAFGIVLAMFGIANERKERALQFVLSLPMSHGDYVRIKLLALLLCYLVVWVSLSAGAILLILAMPLIPDGLLVCAVLLCGFMLANFAVVLCGALHTSSEGVMTLVITVTNMNVTLFMFGVFAIPALNNQIHAPSPTWNSQFWTVLAAELVTLIIALALPYFVAARRRDFI